MTHETHGAQPKPPPRTRRENEKCPACRREDRGGRGSRPRTARAGARRQDCVRPSGVRSLRPGQNSGEAEGRRISGPRSLVQGTVQRVHQCGADRPLFLKPRRGQSLRPLPAGGQWRRPRRPGCVCSLCSLPTHLTGFGVRAFCKPAHPEVLIRGIPNSSGVQ